MLGTGLGHYIPIVAYLGFWIMCLVSLGGKPLYGLYYMIPFLPYRTLRDHFLDYPLGANVSDHLGDLPSLWAPSFTANVSRSPSSTFSGSSSASTFISPCGLAR